MIAFLAPGQGSQTEGMLSPWLDLAGATDQLEIWSKASGLDLEEALRGGRGLLGERFVRHIGSLSGECADLLHAP